MGSSLWPGDLPTTWPVAVVVTAVIDASSMRRFLYVVRVDLPNWEDSSLSVAGDQTPRCLILCETEEATPNAWMAQQLRFKRYYCQDMDFTWLQTHRDFSLVPGLSSWPSYAGNVVLKVIRLLTLNSGSQELCSTSSCNSDIGSWLSYANSMFVLGGAWECWKV